MTKMQPDLVVTINATFCATLVDQWIAEGMTDAFIAPGSRSTPLALALTGRQELSIHIFHDERSAAFAALGNGLASGHPAVLLCSSGTAGAHFHAAVIEADTSCVPMLVCTADRPPELWGTGAPQTINQTELYGAIVRSFVEPGPPEDSANVDDEKTWRSLAQDAYLAAAAVERPGPVHLNLSFRDPLVGAPAALGPALPNKPTSNASAVTAASQAAAFQAANRLIGACTDTQGAPLRGALVVGRTTADAASILSFAAKLGWPVLADHRSGCRSGSSIRHFDSLLRSDDFIASHRPDVVVRVGEIVASKAVSQWLSKLDCPTVATMPWGRRIDPEDVQPEYLPEPSLFESANSELQQVEPPAPWLQTWTDADQSANKAIRAALHAHPGLAEPTVARTALAGVTSGGALVVSASMPVRDLEWFGENRNDVAVYANRGANGIDGVTSTAIGVALTGIPTVCLIGDVAFLHDTNALIALSQRKIDLTIVVTDNDGGGIFSFLPQQRMLASERYEQLFGTPHNTDLAALVASHNIAVTSWSQPMTLPVGGVQVVLATTNRDQNLTLHNTLVQAVADAGLSGQTMSTTRPR